MLTMWKIGRLAAALVVAPVAVLLTGCQTVVNGFTQPIAVTTSPPGALVQVEGFPVQMTPAVVRLPRGTDAVITITKAGYEPQTVTVTSTLANGSLGQTIASGAVVGAAIDLASGAAYRLTPDKIELTLKPLPGGVAGGAVAATLEVPAAPVASEAAPQPKTPKVRAGLIPSSRERIVSANTPPRNAEPAEATAWAEDDPRAPQARLRHIRTMLAEGLITDDEYQMLRASILREMAQAQAPAGG